MATPVQAKPAVIRVDPLEGRENFRETLRLIIACVVSATIHGVLFLLFYLVMGNPLALAKDDTSPAAPQEINTKIEAPETKEPILTNVEVGIEPEVPTNYDVNRIEEVSVPGPVDSNAAVGIAGAPEGPPVTIPPPPGSGRGQGGAEVMPGIDGTGLDREIKGGLRGLHAIPGGFAGRSGATREKTANEGGGSPASEAAVAKGLKWLALHQAPDGHWSLDQYHTHARPDVNSNRFFNDNARGQGGKNDTAGAAFGVLPFLAAGITHKASGRPQDDQYVKTVLRAMNYLMSKQDKKDGSFPGGMYAHGLASIAMCEAYGLTADPMLKRHAQAALNYIIQAQDPQGGGWRYSPRQGGDTSVVGWQVMALKSGQMSGLNVPNITLKLAEKYLDDCESHNGSEPSGGYGYVPKSGETPTMSAVGLLCRQYLGMPRRNPALQIGVKKLMASPPASTKNIYYQYYATQVFHHMGGEYWDFWNKGPGGKNGMRDTLIAEQGKDGSWDPNGDGHAGAGGRIMVTSLSMLTLEVYYRHLPLYQRVDTKK